MSSPKIWKVIELLKTTTDFFQKKNIDNPRLNAEVILAHSLNLDRIALYLDFERPLSNKEFALYRSMIARRANNEPLQYIVGQTEFMGLPFLVNPSVLIPRPETETLVEEILELKQVISKPISILDIGTGSGCIAITLAHHWPGSEITAVDISPGAIQKARENALLNKTTYINFMEVDIFKIPGETTLNRAYDLVVSNPPYISKSEIKDLQPEVKDFEPNEALTDFEDGLKFYLYIFDLMEKNILKCKWLFFEMSGSQPEKIVAEAKKRNFTDIKITKDLNSINRVLRIEI